MHVRGMLLVIGTCLMAHVCGYVCSHFDDEVLHDGLLCLPIHLVNSEFICVSCKDSIKVCVYVCMSSALLDWVGLRLPKTLGAKLVADLDYGEGMNPRRKHK